MSHFSVLVIGEDVEGQLQPYHEFECTGRDDEFVQDVDELAEHRAAYLESTEDMLRDPYEGQLHKFFTPEGNWDPRFSKVMPAEPGPFSQERREKFVPEGFTEVEVPTRTVQTFSDYLLGEGFKIRPAGAPITDDTKYGYQTIDETHADPEFGGPRVTAVVNRTNPNKRWDWWEVGGRWKGFFLLKADRFGTPIDPHWMTREDDSAEVARLASGRYADAVEKSWVDFSQMRLDAEAKAGKLYDKIAAATNGQTWISWEAAKAQARVVPVASVNGVEPEATDDDVVDYAKAREIYWAQPAVKAAQAVAHGAKFDEFLQTRDAYISAAWAGALSTFAVVKDGEWFERGRMGWFGVSSNDKPKAEWDAWIAATIAALPDNTRLTIVDCHI